MDWKLVAWARAVKARTRHGVGPGLPPLWLFTDAGRMADVAAVVSQLPKGLCGVVFRHDGAAGRAEMLHRVWRVCRSRRLVLVVAGGGPVPCGVGRHRRGGAGRLVAGVTTSSAHCVADLTRAGRSETGAAFYSPVFPTSSHPDGAWLGPVRFAGGARRARLPVFALGGIDGVSVRRLPRWVMGVGAIGALVGP